MIIVYQLLLEVVVLSVLRYRGDTTLGLMVRQMDDDTAGFNDGRGGHNRIFTEDEEKELVDDIRGTELAIGTLLHDHDIVCLAMEKWHSLHRRSALGYNVQTSLGIQQQRSSD